MDRKAQKGLLKDISRQVTANLLARAKDWPEDWDGHDLRELLAYAFNQERTTLMRESRERRKAVANEIAVRNLY